MTVVSLSTGTMAQPSEAASARSSSACPVTWTQKEHRAYSRAVYLKRVKVTQKAQRRVLRLRICQRTPEAQRNAKRLTRKHRKARDIWRIRFNNLGVADRAWAKSTGACESGNNPGTNTGNGFYGAMQWVTATWYAAGGKVHPCQASIYEHWVRAVRWRNKTSDEQWPVCGD